MLSLDGLVARYGRITALHGVSMQVSAGQIACLLGANGAGKSTLLNCISGMVPGWSGDIRFEGRSLAGLSPDRIVSAGIVQVPEGRAVFRSMTVWENLELGAWHRRGPEVRSDLDRMLGWFPVLRKRLRQPAGTLSGGEQQMLMIARALLARPRLLLLDEPSLGLSPVMVQKIFAVVEMLRDTGISVLLVEQNAHAALSLSERGYVLENGEIVAEGSAASLIANEAVRDAYLGGARNVA